MLYAKEQNGVGLFIRLQLKRTKHEQNKIEK